METLAGPGFPGIGPGPDIMLQTGKSFLEHFGIAPGLVVLKPPDLVLAFVSAALKLQTQERLALIPAGQMQDDPGQLECRDLVLTELGYLDALIGVGFEYLHAGVIGAFVGAMGWI